MDNVSLPGSGQTVATDFVSGSHMQIVKLNMGLDGESLPLTGRLLSDSMPNPHALTIGAFLCGWDGNGWQRNLLFNGTSDSRSTAFAGVLVNANNYLFDGTNFFRARGDTLFGMDVDVTRVSGTVQIHGNVAHDGADEGNPLKVGYRAIAHGTNPTAVAANDRTDGYANRHGIPFGIGGHPNVQTFRANYTAAQTNTQVLTGSTGLKIVVTRITVTADNANSVDVAVRLGFGTTTTPTALGVLAAHPGIDAGGGFTIGDGSGILGVGGDGQHVLVTAEVPTGGSIDCVLSYYTVDS